jgi:hypothetical protein
MMEKKSVKPIFGFSRQLNKKPPIPTASEPPSEIGFKDMRGFLALSIADGMEKCSEDSKKDIDRFLSPKDASPLRVWRLYSYFLRSIEAYGLAMTDDWMRKHYEDDWRLVGPIANLSEAFDRMILSDINARSSWPRLGGPVVCLYYVAGTAIELILDFAMNILSTATEAQEEVDTIEGRGTIREWTTRIIRLAKEWDFKDVTQQVFRRDIDILKLRLDDEFKEVLQSNSNTNDPLSANGFSRKGEVLYHNGKPVKLPPKPLKVLNILYSQVGYFVREDDLFVSCSNSSSGVRKDIMIIRDLFGRDKVLTGEKDGKTAYLLTP